MDLTSSLSLATPGPSDDVTIALPATPEFKTPDLAKALHSARLLVSHDDYRVSIRQEVRRVRLSFRGLEDSRLTIAAIINIALLIRQCASDGREVIVDLPAGQHGTDSRLQSQLSRLKFTDLFDESAGSWTQYITLTGACPIVSADESHSSRAHYLPLNWFDASWFIARPVVGSPGALEPALSSRREAYLKEVMLESGALDEKALHLLTNVICLQLGWNAIQHSTHSSKDAIGVLGGVIIASDGGARSIDFCLGDWGVGIPHRLHQQYMRSGSTYHDQHNCSKATAIVRSSLDPDAHVGLVSGGPSDATGDRGLKRVAAELNPPDLIDSDWIKLASSGGMVVLERRAALVHPTLNDDFAHHPLPGTQVFVHLSVAGNGALARSDVNDKLVPALDIALVRHDGELSDVVPTSDVASEHTTRASERDFLVDLDFQQMTPAQFERIFRSSTAEKHRAVLFWNAPSGPNDLERLLGRLISEVRELPQEILLVRSSCDALHWRCRSGTAAALSPYSLESWLISPGSRAMQKNDAVGGRVQLVSSVFGAIAEALNTNYLEDGFGRPNVDQGFYQGKIHLLSGRTVRRFFSIVRNIAAGDGVHRWATTCAAGIDAIRSKFPETHSFVVLGIGVAMREILARAWEDCGFNAAAHVLMTYDIPTREELRAALASTSASVILVSDFVSSGSLLEATTDALDRMQLPVVGVLALVDARDGQGLSGPAQSATWVVGSRLTPGDSVSQSVEEEYWVDPVSSIPTTVRPGGTLDPRIHETLNILCDSHSLKCGHIVDGTRHMSVFVDVQALVTEKGEWLFKRLQDECDRRMKQRGWKAFNPVVVMFPTGIARIESLGGADNKSSTIVFDAPVREYLPLIQRLWPDIKAIEVPRAFDPGGRARCARKVELGDAPDLSNADVIVADDCLWTGNSAEQIVRLAVAHGARRVLVVPLLARLHQDRLLHWENVTQTQTDEATCAEVCYAFPMVLPIPSYSAQDCPYENTISKLHHWTGRSRVLEEEEQTIRNQLAGLRPSEALPRSRDYCSTWLKLRTYVELALEDEESLHNLIDMIQHVPPGDRRWAALAVFLEDWTQVGRARLRQNVRPQLRNLALRVLEDKTSTHLEIVAACSLLRAFYRNDYVNQLPRLKELVSRNVPLLGRVVSQVASLPPAARGNWHSKTFLRAVTTPFDWLASAVDPAERDRVSRLATFCRQLLMTDRPVPLLAASVRESRHALLDLIDQQDAGLHDARGMVEILSGQAIQAATAETLKLFAERWSEHRVELFERQLLPLLKQLESQILLTITCGAHVATTESDYFAAPMSATSPLIKDLSWCGSALNALARSQGSTFTHTKLQAAADRLFDHVLSRHSRLTDALQRMQGPQLTIVAKRATQQLRAFLSGIRGLDIRTEGLDRFIGTEHVFCPSATFWKAYGAMLDNVYRHAFTFPNVANARVCIYFDELVVRGQRGVLCGIAHNGDAIREPIRPSPTSKRADGELRQFDGVLHAPRAAATRPGFSVALELEVVLI
jgi:adenine/guanine phosphoribosyltransferase-like PRPP-binding protein